ncbi:MAG: hypothetical protein A2162_11995 [Deltaproteobacteria bacterium RBG_13_52_11b]|nr:MAG: hypothetical protein A2162_11995 [Deltaproteobacteria bacterium RBG_13_52_11b]
MGRWGIGVMGRRENSKKKFGIGELGGNHPLGLIFEGQFESFCQIRFDPGCFMRPERHLI